MELPELWTFQIDAFQLLTSQIDAFLNTILNANELSTLYSSGSRFSIQFVIELNCRASRYSSGACLERPKLGRSEINVFLHRTLDRNKLWSSQSSGRPKSILFLIQFLIEMNCGASRAPRNIQSFGGAKSMLFLNRILNRNELWSF